MYKLIKGKSFNDVFAVDEHDEFAGQLVNDPSGGLHEQPDNTGGPGVFSRVFDGHGPVIHLLPQPSPYGVTDWGQAFENTELIPIGTENLFLDCQFNCEAAFRAEFTAGRPQA